MRMDDNSFWFLIILLFAIWWNVDEYFENKELQIRYETYYKISQLNNEDKIELKNIIDESIKEKEK